MTSEMHQLISVGSRVAQTQGSGATGRVVTSTECVCVRLCMQVCVRAILGIQSYVDWSKNRRTLRQEALAGGRQPST